MNIRRFFKTDFLPSIVVFLVALPLCLGIALASGAPLLSGLLAGIIGGIVVGTLSGSQLSVSGPAAGLASIVVLSIQDLGSFQVFLLSVVLAGLFQIILGYLKAGVIGNFFPVSVIKGMLAAIGLILILKQIPHALGYDVDYEGDESFDQVDGQNTFTEIMTAIEALTAGPILICIISIGLLLLWNSNRIKAHKWLGQIPGPLVVVVSAILLNSVFFQYFFPSLFIEAKHLVSLPSFSMENLTTLISMPDFSQWMNPKVYTVALTLAIVASLETLLSIEACEKMDESKRITPLNTELKAQGVGNLLSGLLGGLPVTSVIVRSSANILAGAKTKASTISHGFLLLFAVLLIPGILQLIPLASLAGILIVTGFKLTEPTLYKETFRKGRSQFLPFIITVLAVTTTDLLQGVFIGVLVSVFFILKTNFQEALILVGDEKKFLLKMTKDVSFLHKSTLRSKLLQVPPGSDLMIDGSQAQFVDNDIKEAIRDFIDFSRTSGISVELKNIKLK